MLKRGLRGTVGHLAEKAELPTRGQTDDPALRGTPCQVLDHLVRTGLAQVGHEHGDVLRGQFPRDRRADAPVGAGDQCDVLNGRAAYGGPRAQ
ncbi:hypothetical protein GCM10010174_63390 [Kutzneria viridogrisea]